MTVAELAGKPAHRKRWPADRFRVRVRLIWVRLPVIREDFGDPGYMSRKI